MSSENDQTERTLPAPGPPPGTMLLGRYRVMAPRGSGGFGQVLTCWDTRLQRRVAVKRIPLALDSTPAGRLDGATTAFDGQYARYGRFFRSASGIGGVDPAQTPRDTRHDRVESSIARIKSTAAAGAAAIARDALDEARVASLLEHPGIVVVHDFETDAAFAYLVMEDVDGLTLAELLARVEGGRLTTDEAAYLLRKVAAALAIAHENGVLHLDIKPANIMLTAAGDVKLCDFGVATLASAAGYGDARGGTVGYMAPEQIGDGLVDERTDVFALAVVVWEALTGTNPFAAETADASLARIRRGARTSLSRAAGGARGGGWAAGQAPADAHAVDAIVAEALAADPARRPADVAAFADELASALGDEQAGGASLAALLAQATDADEGELPAPPVAFRFPWLADALTRAVAAALTAAVIAAPLDALVAGAGDAGGTGQISGDLPAETELVAEAGLTAVGAGSWSAWRSAAGVAGGDACFEAGAGEGLGSSDLPAQTPLAAGTGARVSVAQTWSAEGSAAGGAACAEATAGDAPKSGNLPAKTIRVAGAVVRTAASVRPRRGQGSACARLGRVPALRRARTAAGDEVGLSNLPWETLSTAVADEGGIFQVGSSGLAEGSVSGASGDSVLIKATVGEELGLSDLPVQTALAAGTGARVSVARTWSAEGSAAGGVIRAATSLPQRVAAPYAGLDRAPALRRAEAVGDEPVAGDLPAETVLVAGTKMRSATSAQLRRNEGSACAGSGRAPALRRAEAVGDEPVAGDLPAQTPETSPAWTAPALTVVAAAAAAAWPAAGVALAAAALFAALAAPLATPADTMLPALAAIAFALWWASVARRCRHAPAAFLAPAALAAPAAAPAIAGACLPPARAAVTAAGAWVFTQFSAASAATGFGADATLAVLAALAAEPAAWLSLAAAALAAALVSAALGNRAAVADATAELPAPSLGRVAFAQFAGAGLNMAVQLAATSIAVAALAASGVPGITAGESFAGLSPASAALLVTDLDRGACGVGGQTETLPLAPRAAGGPRSHREHFRLAPAAGMDLAEALSVAAGPAPAPAAGAGAGTAAGAEPDRAVDPAPDQAADPAMAAGPGPAPAAGTELAPAEGADRETGTDQAPVAAVGLVPAAGTAAGVAPRVLAVAQLTGLAPAALADAVRAAALATPSALAPPTPTWANAGVLLCLCLSMLAGAALRGPADGQGGGA